MFLLAAALSLTVSQDATPTADRALVQRFMAAIPQAHSRPDSEINGAELERLIALNSGRAEELEALMREEARCGSRATRAASEQVVRTVASSLGDEQLRRLIAFYEGPDFDRFGVLIRLPAATLSADEAADLRRILAAYPLKLFREASERARRALWDDPAAMMEAFDRCRAERQAAMERLGLASD